VDGPIIINTDDDEIEIHDDNDDDDDGIIAVEDIPHDNNAGAHATFDDSEDNIDAGNDKDNDSNDDDSDDEEASIEHESDDEVSVPGVRRSKRKTKGTTTRFAEYDLMMEAQRQARKGKECRATIQDGMMFFSGDSLSDAKPIPEEDHEEWVLGVALAQYSITAGLKKFKEKGKKGVTKELTQMHDMNVFTPVRKESLSVEERTKALASLMFLKEKRDKTVKV
jgi:hypothetical protein